MSDWICPTCNNIIRGRTSPPVYCSKCGLSQSKFIQAASRPVSGSGTPGSSPQESTPPKGMAAAPSLNLQVRRLTAVLAVAQEPRQERRRTKRVRPKKRVAVRLCRTAPLPVVDISAGGLSIEHTAPFKPGSVCEVELEGSGQTIRFRGEVVRSTVMGGAGKERGIRYLTAVEFLEAPGTIQALLQELAEES